MAEWINEYDPEKVTLEDCIRSKEEKIHVVLSNGHVVGWGAEEGYKYPEECSVPKQKGPRLPFNSF